MWNCPLDDVLFIAPLSDDLSFLNEATSIVPWISGYRTDIRSRGRSAWVLRNRDSFRSKVIFCVEAQESKDHEYIALVQ